MITKFIKTLFGGSSAEEPVEVPVAQVPAGDVFIAQAIAADESEDLEKFVEFIVRGLVDKPDEVSITTDDGDNDSRMLRINCAKEDVGKVVGKRGKTIIALRSLINGAAGRLQKRVLLEVAD